MAFKPSYFKADLFEVLSSPVRIQILDVLRLGGASSNYIAQWIEVEVASVTKHLFILHDHKLVKPRREGTCIIYLVSDPAIFKMLDATLEVFNDRRAEVKDTPRATVRRGNSQIPLATTRRFIETDETCRCVHVPTAGSG